MQVILLLGDVHLQVCVHTIPGSNLRIGLWAKAHVHRDVFTLKWGRMPPTWGSYSLTRLSSNVIRVQGKLRKSRDIRATAMNALGSWWPSFVPWSLFLHLCKATTKKHPVSLRTPPPGHHDMPPRGAAQLCERRLTPLPMQVSAKMRPQPSCQTTRCRPNTHHILTYLFPTDSSLEGAHGSHPRAAYLLPSCPVTLTIFF